MESDALITHHLADLGLIKLSNLPRSGSKKNSSQNFFVDANIEKYSGDEDSFWNFYKDVNITLYASQTYKDEQKEKEGDEVENQFFVPREYPSDEEEEKDEDEKDHDDDNDDDPGAIRACLEAELTKGPRKHVAKFPIRFATRFPRNCVTKQSS